MDRTRRALREGICPTPSAFPGLWLGVSHVTGSGNPKGNPSAKAARRVRVTRLAVPSHSLALPFIRSLTRIFSCSRCSASLPPPPPPKQPSELWDGGEASSRLIFAPRDCSLHASYREGCGGKGSKASWDFRPQLPAPLSWTGVRRILCTETSFPRL